MNTVEISASPLTSDQVAFFHREGYLIVKETFSAAEVDELKTHFEDLTEGRWQMPTDMWSPDLQATDPLQRYPRVMFPHRHDALSKHMLLHPKVGAILQQLLEDAPIATQSMFYFKPPGSRGQAFHQDNFYLQIEPGTCIAAWTAIDPSLPENGGLFVVPHTQDMELVCPEQADMKESFFQHLVRPPPGKKAVPAELQPGDTLFFNGSVIHGSGPNRSKTEWRRSFICHYMPATTKSLHQGYFPRDLLNFAGESVEYPGHTKGGPCGTEFTKGVYGA